MDVTVYDYNDESNSLPHCDLIAAMDNGTREVVYYCQYHTTSLNGTQLGPMHIFRSQTVAISDAHKLYLLAMCQR